MSYGSGFSSGAGFTLAQSSGLFTMILGFTIVTFLSFLLIGGLIAWRKRELEFGEYGAYVIRGFFFLVIIVTFLGLI